MQTSCSVLQNFPGRVSLVGFSKGFPHFDHAGTSGWYINDHSYLVEVGQVLMMHSFLAIIFGLLTLQEGRLIGLSSRLRPAAEIILKLVPPPDLERYCPVGLGPQLRASGNLYPPGLRKVLPFDNRSPLRPPYTQC